MAQFTDHVQMLAFTVAASLAVCSAYWYAVRPSDRVVWLPLVIIMVVIFGRIGHFEIR